MNVTYANVEFKKMRTKSNRATLVVKVMNLIQHWLFDLSMFVLYPLLREMSAYLAANRADVLSD